QAGAAERHDGGDKAPLGPGTGRIHLTRPEFQCRAGKRRRNHHHLVLLALGMAGDLFYQPTAADRLAREHHDAMTIVRGGFPPWLGRKRRHEASTRIATPPKLGETSSRRFDERLPAVPRFREALDSDI